MQPIPVFWVDPTPYVATGLRRYSRTADSTGFTCETGYHQALTFTTTAPALFTDHGTIAPRPSTPHTDISWPTRCDNPDCDYVFTPDDAWQDWQDLIYARRDNPILQYVMHSSAPAHELDLPSLPPGAMWDSHWLPTSFTQPPYPETPDLRCVTVRTPGPHDWQVDTQASNCTRPGEPHHCWVRHGDPREPQAPGAPFHVDKNGDTCQAGGGSIQTPDWHGFLHHGQLTLA